MNILVTGCAGFIGFHLTKTLLNQGVEIIGLDNLNNYYDPILKKRRLEQLQAHKNFKFLKVDICDTESIEFNLRSFKVSQIIHLAAQAGVRHSISNPRDYLNNNIIGFFNILEYARANSVEHLTYASTSSTYGANRMLPFAEKNHADHPIQFYAATKRANELMAHSYSCIYGLPTSGLRFFTVYGPWGRPDMALFKFTKNILKGKPIHVFNYGKHSRDFTYVDDIVDGIFKILISKDKKISSSVYNIGCGNKVPLSKYIKLIEKFLQKKSKKKLLPLQKGDVIQTHSDINLIKKDFKYIPKTKVENGVKKFIDWYISYYK